MEQKGTLTDGFSVHLSWNNLAQVERKFRRLAIASVLVQTYSYTSALKGSAPALPG